MNLTLGDIELPVRLRLERRLTDAELERFCALNDLLQVERDENGEMILMPPTFSEGGAIEADVIGELRNWARADGRGRAFGPGAGFTLGDTSVRSADASWILLERWNALSETQRKLSYAPICPEFVIEIRGVKDKLKHVEQKMEMWIENGAEVAWLIDPQRKMVEIYRPGEFAESRHNPDRVLGEGPVLGFELLMDRVWGGQ